MKEDKFIIDINCKLYWGGKVNDIRILANAFDVLDYGVYVLKDGEIIYCNSVIADMWNCTRREFREDYAPKRLREQGRVDTLVSDVVAQTFQKTALCQKLVDVDGNEKLVFTTQTPIFDGEGNIAYIIGHMQEIDKIKDNYLHAIDASVKHFNINIIQSAHEERKVIYESEAMKEVISQVLNIADVDAPVLLQGETGVGKDVIANFLHDTSSRKKKEMVKINCAAIPANLFESELFGYEKGAFTGALSSGKRGLIERANGGTLFLDEVNSMPLEFQGKMLRVLDTKTVQRVGGSKPIPVDFRIVAATNSDLSECVMNKEFRLDLFFRLSVLPITIPALRERIEDIQPLSEYFVALLCNKYNRNKRLTPSAIEKMKKYPWPGNVRELRNFLERLVLMSDIAVSDINDFPNKLLYKFDLPVITEKYDAGDTELTQVNTDTDEMEVEVNENYHLSLKDRLAEYEKNILQQALMQYSSQEDAAKALGMNSSTFSRRIAKYGLWRYCGGKK